MSTVTFTNFPRSQNFPNLSKPSPNPNLLPHRKMDLSNPKFLAVIDMGSNSFKLLIVRAESNGKFLVIDHFKEPVVLARGMISNSSSISPESIIKATLALQKFNQILQKNHKICQTQIVATSAVREAVNQGEFLFEVKEKSGFGDNEIRVLSGDEEARFVYMGILQFLPVFDKTVLAVDIGGGSTEFVIGKFGKVLYSISLKLGHVSLTDEFVKEEKMTVNMRSSIRSVIYESGLVEKVEEIGFDIAVGSSGTIKSIEKAVSLGYGCGLNGSVGAIDGEFSRDWKFNKEELVGVVEKLCEGGDDNEEIRRKGFFKRRSEFIVAGSVLLLEIFEILGINEMEVSEYALGEGVIAETLASCCEDYDIKANARWLSVAKLATRFNTDKRMKLASLSVGIAKEMFESLRKSDELANRQFLDTLSLDEKDLEYLEAACLLHNIGLCIGKKGYHKHSYHIIKNGQHLHGYSTEEVELIALLARHHRKKFPKSTQGSLEGFPKEVKLKFKILCAILRISIAVQHCKLMTFHGLETSNCQEGFKLVFNEKCGQPLPPGEVKISAEDVEAELNSELNHFQEAAKMKLLIAVSPSS